MPNHQHLGVHCHRLRLQGRDVGGRRAASGAHSPCSSCRLAVGPRLRADGWEARLQDAGGWDGGKGARVRGRCACRAITHADADLTAPGGACAAAAGTHPAAIARAAVLNAA